MTSIPALLSRGLILTLMLAAPAVTISAQQVADGGDLRVEAGAAPARIRDTLGGYEIVEYRFVAVTGDRVKIDFTTSSPDGAFNIMAPGDGRMIYESERSGRRFEGTLPTSGEYRLRVYLGAAAARRGEHTAYDLTLALAAGAAPGRNETAGTAAPRPQGDDGLVIYAPEPGAAAPAPRGNPLPYHDDYAWHVSGLNGRPLPILSGAGPQFRIIGQLEEGSPVDNLGCQDGNAGYWCRIATVTRPRLSGWVNGRYLTDAGSGRENGAGRPYIGVDVYAGGRRPGGPGGPYDSTGPIRCQFGGAGQMMSCSYGIVRNGTTSQVDVQLPDGSSRSFEYRAGRYSGMTPGANVESERRNGQAVVTVNGRDETYYIPDDVVMGE